MNDIAILKSNSVYRIGDIFLCNGPRFKKDREEILNNKKYQNTILYDYLIHKSNEKDYTLLNDCIKTYINKNHLKIPHQNELVVHVRLGDIVGNTLHRKSKFSYESVKRKYSDLISNDLFNEYNINNATIVTALHFGNDVARNRYLYEDDAKIKSLDILNDIETQIKQQNISYSIISNENIDVDFCYMANAKYFKQSFGGFSQIISELVSINGGISFDLL